jgi:hypothetical protein
VENKGAAGCIIYIYYAATATALYTGTGVTLISGDEQTIEATDPGPIQAFLLAQNGSSINGSLDFTPLS